MEALGAGPEFEGPSAALQAAFSTSAALYRSEAQWSRSIDCCQLLIHNMMPNQSPDQKSKVLSWHADALMRINDSVQALAIISQAYELHPSCCNIAMLTRCLLRIHGDMASEPHAHILRLLHIIESSCNSAPTLSTAEQLDRLLFCAVAALQGKST